MLEVSYELFRCWVTYCYIISFSYLFLIGYYFAIYAWVDDGFFRVLLLRGYLVVFGLAPFGVLFVVLRGCNFVVLGVAFGGFLVSRLFVPDRG